MDLMSILMARRGVATLDSNGVVSADQLPADFDDLQEFTNRQSFPLTGREGMVYVDRETGDSYRWTGSQYTLVASPNLPIASTEDLGAVKVGEGLDIDEEGTLSVNVNINPIVLEWHDTPNQETIDNNLSKLADWNWKDSIQLDVYESSSTSISNLLKLQSFKSWNKPTTGDISHLLIFTTKNWSYHISYDVSLVGDSKILTSYSQKKEEIIPLASDDVAGLVKIGPTLEIDEWEELNIPANTYDPYGAATQAEAAAKAYAIPASEKGAVNGVATLNANGQVPQSQLPSYVDDVIEGYLYNGVFYSSDPNEVVTAEEITPESGKIYVDLTTNNSYRWSGSIFVEISKSLAIGTTTGTAFDGAVGNNHIEDSDIHVTAEEKAAWNDKQNALTAGNGIAIENDTISVSSTNIDYILEWDDDSSVYGNDNKTKLLNLLNYDLNNKLPDVYLKVTPLFSNPSIKQLLPLLNCYSNSIFDNPDSYWSNPIVIFKFSDGSVVYELKLKYTTVANFWSYSQSTYYLDDKYVSKTLYDNKMSALDNALNSKQDTIPANTYDPYGAAAGAVEAAGAVASGLSAHAQDSIIHVSAQEKATWNGKQDAIPANTYDAYGAAGEVASDLSAHTGDTTIHVSAEEKATWNGKQEALTAGDNITINDNTISASVPDTGWINLGVRDDNAFGPAVHPYYLFANVRGIAYRVINGNHVFVKGVVKVKNSAVANVAIGGSTTNNACVPTVNPIPAQYRPKQPEGTNCNIYALNRTEKPGSPMLWCVENSSGHLVCEGFQGLTGSQSANYATIDVDYFI